jgi:uncharacterized GH25 family protein
LSEYDKALVDGLHTKGVRTCHNLGFMLTQKGDHDGLGFCKKDLYNYLSNQESATIEGYERAVTEYNHVLRTKLEGFELEASKFFTRNKFSEV